MSADIYQVLHNPTGDAASVAYTGTAGDIAQTVRGNCLMAWCTTDAYISIGATATTTNGTPVPAFTPIWFPFPDSMRQGQAAAVLVSAIQIAAGGTLYMRQFN